MSFSSPYLAAGLAVVLAGSWLAWRRRLARRGERARRLARELMPEIRTISASADPHGSTGGVPVEASVYRLRRDELDEAFSAEARFAIDVFYRSVEAYDEAHRAMVEAFRDDSGLSLGDRIRAKDRRDRLLKDVYTTGEAAVQKLEAMR